MLSIGSTQPNEPCLVTPNITTQPGSGCTAEPMYINAYEDEITSLVLSMDILASIEPDVLDGSMSVSIPPTAFFEENGAFVAYIVSNSTQLAQASRRR